MIHRNLDGSYTLTDDTDPTRTLEVATVGELQAAAAGFFPIIVPETVSPRQIKLALLAAGMLDAVETFVASHDRATQISWNYAVEWRRDDPLLVALSLVFGLTPAQVDGLFVTAATL